MGFIARSSWNGWAALAASVVAGCSGTSAWDASNPSGLATERTADEIINEELSARVRETFARTANGAEPSDRFRGSLARAERMTPVRPAAVELEPAETEDASAETSPSPIADIRIRNNKLQSVTLAKPVPPAFLSAPRRLRSVTVNRDGQIVAWEPVIGRSRAAGLIGKNILAGDSPRIELIAQPNADLEHPNDDCGLVFTPLADGSLVYTAE